MSNNSDELKKTTERVMYVPLREGSCTYKPVVMKAPLNTTSNIK